MTDSALVLFSGGQDSTTCLAWALERYAHVETVGFDYGQRHRIELDCRADILAALKRDFPAWAARLGDDHMLDLSILGQLSETALTQDKQIAFAGERPAQHLRARTQPAVLHLRRRHRLPARHQASRRRHVRDRLLRLSRLPRRHAEGAAGRAQSRHGAALRGRDAADVDRQGADLGAGQRDRRRQADARSCWSTRIPATWATARTGTTGAMAAAPARPASCGARAGFAILARTVEDSGSRPSDLRHLEADFLRALPEHGLAQGGTDSPAPTSA